MILRKGMGSKLSLPFQISLHLNIINLSTFVLDLLCLLACLFYLLRACLVGGTSAGPG
jgi:hypothetical protein